MQFQDIQKLAQDQGVPVSQQDLSRLAASEEGQQLMKLLGQDGGAAVRSALEALQAGDQNRAKQVMTQTLSSPEAMKLLQKLGQNHG